MSRSHKRTAAGFTIVELMIALAVFSVLLILVLAAITQMTRMYYKGVITARTQQSTRELIDRVAQQVQFSSDQPVVDAANKQVCIDGQLYTYGFSDAKSPSFLKRSNGCSGIVSGEISLLPEGLEVTDFSVQQLGASWQITIGLANGGRDLRDQNGACKGSAVDTQFCATSVLSTTVKRRVQ